MFLLSLLFLLFGLLYMAYAIGAVFVFVFCFIMGLCIIVKNLFFPKTNDYYGPLI